MKNENSTLLCHWLNQLGGSGVDLSNGALKNMMSDDLDIYEDLSLGSRKRLAFSFVEDELSLVGFVPSRVNLWSLKHSKYTKLLL